MRENPPTPKSSIFSMSALDDLRRAGAAIVDPAKVEGLETVQRQPGMGTCMGFKYDLNRFLAERAGLVPIADLTAIIKSGKFHPSVQKRLEDSEKGRRERPGFGSLQSGQRLSRAVRARPFSRPWTA